MRELHERLVAMMDADGVPLSGIHAPEMLGYILLDVLAEYAV